MLNAYFDMMLQDSVNKSAGAAKKEWLLTGTTGCCRIT